MKFFSECEIIEYKIDPLYEVVFKAVFPDFAKVVYSENIILFQNSLRNLGYHNYKVDKSDDSADLDKDDIVHRFTSREQGLIVNLTKNSIEIICYKKYNIKSFERYIMEVLSYFVEHYSDFVKFTNIQLIHRNMINKTIINDTNFDIYTHIPNHVFPELELYNLDEIDSINKSIMFESVNTLCQIRYNLAAVNGEYGSMNISSEDSFTVNIHILENIELGDINETIDCYRRLYKTCWCGFHNIIGDKLRSQITE